MGCRLKDSVLVVLTLLTFKVRGISVFTKNKFFNFCGTERVKENNNKNKLKTIQVFNHLLIFKFNHFSSNSNNFRIFFSFSQKL